MKGKYRLSEKSSNHKLFTNCFTSNQISDTVFSSPCQKAMWAFDITWHPLSVNFSLWRPCLLTDRDEMSNLNRGPAIDASYQVSVHLAQRFQRRRFLKNRPIRNGRKHPWKVLNKDCSFISDPLTNMAATGNSCFWLVDF
jgi:hypothetical protein